MKTLEYRRRSVITQWFCAHSGRRMISRYALGRGVSTTTLECTIRHVYDGVQCIADVDADVSRNHAYIWQDGEHWYLRDLGSTNGTRLVSGGDGSERAVGRSVEEAPELFASDIICLGATTRFMVMPVFGT